MGDEQSKPAPETANVANGDKKKTALSSETNVVSMEISSKPKKIP
jgi:hypothetical protein